MPPIFTRILAERLTAASHIKVQEGRQGELLRPGMGYIAPGDFSYDRAPLSRVGARS